MAKLVSYQKLSQRIVCPQLETQNGELKSKQIKATHVHPVISWLFSHPTRTMTVNMNSGGKWWGRRDVNEKCVVLINAG